jgi:hypothetical protein
MRATLSELAGQLELLAAEHDASADAGSLAMDEIGPTQAMRLRARAAWYREWAADIRANKPILARPRRVA